MNALPISSLAAPPEINSAYTVARSTTAEAASPVPWANLRHSNLISDVILMRDDLLDAKAAVDWANAQIPVLQERFIAWQRLRPYEIVEEPDPNDIDWKLLIAYPKIPLDPLIQGDAGAIINSIRAALDLLMSALIKRNGKKPNSDAHFPIRKSADDFLAAIIVMEGKKWVSPTEATAIKRTKAYKGGDHFLYALHQLDILRKHERLLRVEPKISSIQIPRGQSGVEPGFQRMDNKTVLLRVLTGARFYPAQGDTQLAAEILFNEPALLATHQPAGGVLRNFTYRVAALIEGFA